MTEVTTRAMLLYKLQYIPSHFIVNGILRPSLARSGCEAFTQAGFLAQVLVSPNAYHLPLNSQGRSFECEGLGLDRSTLAERVGKTMALSERLSSRSQYQALPGRSDQAVARPIHIAT